MYAHHIYVEINNCFICGELLQEVFCYDSGGDTEKLCRDHFIVSSWGSQIVYFDKYTVVQKNDKYIVVIDRINQVEICRGYGYSALEIKPGLTEEVIQNFLLLK